MVYTSRASRLALPLGAAEGHQRDALCLGPQGTDRGVVCVGHEPGVLEELPEAHAWGPRRRAGVGEAEGTG